MHIGTGAPVAYKVWACRKHELSLEEIHAWRACAGSKTAQADSDSACTVSPVHAQSLWDAVGPDCDIVALNQLLKKSNRARINQTGPWVRILSRVLRHALEKQRSQTCSVCLQTNVKHKTWHFQGCVPLHRAIFHGHSEAVEALLAAGADVNAKTHVRVRLLEQQLFSRLVPPASATSSALASLPFRQSHPPAPSAQHDTTPLHTAAPANRPAVISLLVAAGADVNARLVDKMESLSPLHLAAAAGDASEAIQLLMAAGADVEANTEARRLPTSGFTYCVDTVPILIFSGSCPQLSNPSSAHRSAARLSFQQSCRATRRTPRPSSTVASTSRPARAAARHSWLPRASARWSWSICCCRGSRRGRRGLPSSMR